MRAASALVAAAAAWSAAATSSTGATADSPPSSSDEQLRAALENLPGNDNITYAPTVPLVEFWCEYMLPGSRAGGP